LFRAAGVPIVFSLGTDPVTEGHVASLNRPGGNLTGFTHMSVGIAAKRLEILHDLLPKIRTFAFLTNKSSSINVSYVHEMEAAAAVLGIQVHFADAQTDSDLNPAFERLVRLKVGALALSGDQFHFSRRDQIISLAARHKIPAIYSTRQFVMAGGLMSYGPNLADGYRQIGIMTGRVLNGTSSAQPSSSW
jgi:putative ABC transport system substrate-binding protein